MSRELKTGGDVAVEQAKPRLKKPRMYKVVLHNDDYTPMQFVVELLMQFFYMSSEQAVEIMLQVHNAGKGVCGVFTRDIAETKVTQVNECAREHDHPLLCGMEEA